MVNTAEPVDQENKVFKVKLVHKVHPVIPVPPQKNHRSLVFEVQLVNRVKKVNLLLEVLENQVFRGPEVKLDKKEKVEFLKMALPDNLVEMLIVIPNVQLMHK